MSNIERTNRRDLTYSNLRRQYLFEGCLCTDVDFLEIRGNEIVGVHETKQGFDNFPTDFQKKWLKHSASSLCVPYYLTQFNIAELEQPKEPLRYCKKCGEQLNYCKKCDEIIERKRIITNFRAFKDEVDCGTQRIEDHAKWLKNMKV